MKTLRLGVSLVGTLLLAGGYFASQAAYFNGSTVAYVRALDASAVPLLALLLVLAAVGLAMWPGREDAL